MCRPGGDGASNLAKSNFPGQAECRCGTVGGRCVGSNLSEPPPCSLVAQHWHMWFRTDDHELDELLEKLFRLHDLNSNGTLEELELIQLNKKIAVMHHGKDVDKRAVASHFRDLFRARLNPTGQPVPYSTFRKYMLEVLNEIDWDLPSQRMIVEQFIAEAKVARHFFRVSSMSSETD